MASNQQNRRQQQYRGVETIDSVIRSASIAERLRNEESWVELSSQPSSSSLSSEDNEIVTTGLRIQDNAPQQMRRRELQPHGQPYSLARLTSASSQEEYTESESEDDHVLSSSNEQFPSTVRVAPVVIHRADLETSSDDENSTALGKATPFTPQPNAFSHPPSQTQPREATTSYFPRAPRAPPRSTPVRHRHSYPNHGSHSPYNALSANHKIDTDAALRASLNTLLSAARALPKKGTSTEQQIVQPGSSGFRVIQTPEKTNEEVRISTSPNSSHPRSSSPSDASPIFEDFIHDNHSKRKTIAVRRTSSPQPRPTKKKRITHVVEETTISPTLLTWVVSAGVVILVSVVSAGAGYVYGREVGFDEGLQSASCGGALVKTSRELKRFRWGGNNSIIV